MEASMYKALVLLATLIASTTAVAFSDDINEANQQFSISVSGNTEIGNIAINVELSGNADATPGRVKLDIEGGSVTIEDSTFSVAEGKGIVRGNKVMKVVAIIEDGDIEGIVKMRGEIVNEDGDLEIDKGLIKLKGEDGPSMLLATFTGTGSSSGLFQQVTEGAEGQFELMATHPEQSHQSLEINGNLKVLGKIIRLTDISGTFTDGDSQYEVRGKGKINVNDGEISLNLFLISNGSKSAKLELEGTVNGISQTNIEGTFEVTLEGELESKGDGGESEVSLTGSITISMAEEEES